VFPLHEPLNLRSPRLGAKLKKLQSLRMVKRLHDGLKIPYESLLTEVS
jgi:hypothetical protein